MNRLNFKDMKANLQGRINSIGYGNGLYVAVGEGIYTSQDGKTWILRYSGDMEVYDITFDGINFVAITGERIYGSDYNNLVSLVSTDNGMTWNKKTPSQEPCFINNSIEYMNGKFIALTTSGINLSNDGGNTWQPPVSFPSFYNWNSVCKGKVGRVNDVFLAIGVYYSGEFVTGIVSATSSDGVHWNPNISHFVDTPISVAYGNGIFVALGSNNLLYKSIDGKNWTEISIGPNKLNKITFGKKFFVAAGDDGNVFSSVDGNNWLKENVGSDSTLTEVQFCGNSFMAVSDKGEIFKSASYSLEIIFDGYGSIDWANGKITDDTTVFLNKAFAKLKANNEQEIVITPSGRKIINHEFKGWEGDINTPKNPLDLQIRKDMKLIAKFRPVEEHHRPK